MDVQKVSCARPLIVRGMGSKFRQSLSPEPRTAPHMVIARYLATETRLLAWMIELEPKNTAMRSPDRKLRNSDYICTHPNLTG